MRLQIHHEGMLGSRRLRAAIHAFRQLMGIGPRAVLGARMFDVLANDGDQTRRKHRSGYASAESEVHEPL